MNHKSLLFFVLGLVAFLLIECCGHAKAAIVETIDMTAVTSSEQQNGGADYQTEDGRFFRFSQADFGSSGTGFVNSFLRIQDSPDEHGFNHDRATPAFDEDVAHTHSLTIASVPRVAVGGHTWGEFLLDLNEGSSDQSEITLNQLQIFAVTESFGTDPELTPSALTISTQGNHVISFDNTDAVEIFRLSSEIVQFQVLMDAKLSSGGSGQFDIRFLFDALVLQDLDSRYTNLLLYSQFGEPPGTAVSNGGFEEWAVNSASVPEPRSGLLLLAPIFFAAIWKLRRGFWRYKPTAEALRRSHSLLDY